MGHPAVPEGLQFSREIIFHATDFEIKTVYKKIASATIPIVREADASRIGHS